MDPSLLFSLCNAAVLPFWALLLLAPGWKWTQLLVHSVLIPALLGSVYIATFLVGADMPEGAGFGSLEGVMLIFSVPLAVVGGWVHYLIFDLFIGAWELREARRQGIHHLAVIPCLLLTLMAGPVGLLAFLILRAALRRTLSLVEGAGEGTVEGAGGASDSLATHEGPVAPAGATNTKR
jgi:hypothetical protein